VLLDQPFLDQFAQESTDLAFALCRRDGVFFQQVRIPGSSGQ